MSIKTKEGHPKARKQHTCNYCRNAINIGSVYYHYSTLETGMDQLHGVWTIYKLHLECKDLYFACIEEIYERANHWEEWHDQTFV